MINNKKVVAIIPAREGSKSIKNKNIVLLNGKPLIYYTIKEALKSKYIDKIICSTDSQKIAEIAKKYGAEVPFIRPKELARDDTPDLPVFYHALNWLKTNSKENFDFVLNLRPTSPLRTVQQIDEIIDMMDKTNCDSVKTLIPVKQHPMKMWRLRDQKNNKIEPYLKGSYPEGFQDIPRQKLDTLYWQDACIDITKTEIILNQNKMFGSDMRGFISDKKNYVDIDDYEDLTYAEFKLKMKG